MDMMLLLDQMRAALQDIELLTIETNQSQSQRSAVVYADHDASVALYKSDYKRHHKRFAGKIAEHELSIIDIKNRLQAAGLLANGKQQGNSNK